jgi:hypothetical protein
LVEAFFGVSNEVQGVYAPGPVLYDMLEGDPRKDLWIFDPNAVGAPNVSTFAFQGDYATIANNVIRNEIPHIMFLPSEIDFYRAELALLGVTTEDAQAAFNTGMNNILTFWGNDIPGAQVTLDPADIEAFIAGMPAVSIDQIHEQLYLESFLRPLVSWNTIRRTGTPTLPLPPTTGISTVLKRFTYPPNEAAANVNTPANLPTDTKVWFEN